MAKGERSVRFDMSIPDDLDERILEWRRKQPDLPSRAEAIRRLVRCCLDSLESDKQPS